MARCGRVPAFRSLCLCGCVEAQWGCVVGVVWVVGPPFSFVVVAECCFDGVLFVGEFVVGGVGGHGGFLLCGDPIAVYGGVVVKLCVGRGVR